MFDVIGVSQNKEYKLSLNNALASVRGIENKEDAESCAIVALLEEEPITLDDCIDCMKRAVERFRNSYRKIAKYEMLMQDLAM